MSTETQIATAQPGSIILFSGAAGNYYDAYDQAGRYLGYFGSKSAAESALRKAATDSSKPSDCRPASAQPKKKSP